ncbi:hypothetical protein [Paeniglutamicibacter sp. NPDC091659]|uniref:hypothetical protein n=1 Tax=Paeniglutamicibacter sp. NPDC091659 TaxID=3364389 RepID=UPI003827CC81
MSADREAAKAELRSLLEAEQARADRELRRIKIAWLISGLSFASALVPWLLMGGLVQFVLRNSGYTAVVLVPAWLALLGLAAATFATVLFMMRTLRTVLGNIVERDARKNTRRP